MRNHAEPILATTFASTKIINCDYSDDVQESHVTFTLFPPLSSYEVFFCVLTNWSDDGSPCLAIHRFKIQQQQQKN
jgi:hypothetical protein